ncbi:axoneme-associated protein mst101(2) [Drosophila innubila]|uniref:axoneme-associated protein mst101(2) n=1 Tax=Drosophila innubila TaxID=198719 RepID=UPI00148CE7D9|nr:axoneme-associated protein mst101(2) [Drosophila innubila]
MSMWEDFIKCFKKGTKITGCTETKIAELFNRVPPDQRKQFREFAKKHDEYRQRVRKYPDKMPTIDWKYYRENVRKEMVDWVQDYEKKYDNLDSMFTNRHTMIDFSKYFGEITKQSEEVQKDVCKFKEESEKRIKVLQNKMKELESMRPYTEMTMEEFCIAHPNEAPDFRNKPTFWPHTPEEQAEEELAEKEAAKEDKPDPSKPAPSGTAPKDAKPKTPPKAKEPEPVKKAVDTPKKEEKAEVAAVKVEEKESMESQITDKVTDLASKGIDLVKDLGSKAIVLLKGLWQKAENKRREVAESAKAERLKKESSDAAVKTVSSKDLGGSSEICNKTIIRGEDTAEADVKEHHADLTIEGQSDADVCKEKSKAEEKESDADICKQMSKDEEKICEKDVATVCFEKYQEKIKDERLSAAEKKSCAESVKEESTKATGNQCEDVCKEKPKDTDNKCKPDERASLPDITLRAEPKKPLTTCELNQVPPTNAVTSPAPNLVVKSSNAGNDTTIIGMHQEVLTAENEIFLGAKQLPKGPKDFKPSDKDNAQQVKEVTQELKGEKTSNNQKQTDNAPVTMKSDQKGQDKNDDKSMSDAMQQGINEGSDEIAKVMFKMAIGAAQLLAEAKKKIEQAQRENSGQAEALKHAFEAAGKQVDLALSQAHTALESAKKLTHRAQFTLGDNEEKLVATIEKHTVLAKLLANKAMTMQKEIDKLLDGLKKQQ